MMIYVESNFVLELTLLQKQYQACQEIIELCSNNHAKLVVPSFSIAEPFQTVVRRSREIRDLNEKISIEIQQQARSMPYQNRAKLLQSITGFHVKYTAENMNRLNNVIENVLKIAEIIPISYEIMTDAIRLRKTTKLDENDSIVYASVINHLANSKEIDNCFLNVNFHDFDKPNIVNELKKNKCSYFNNFVIANTAIRKKLNL
jgi:predicted nucleic acid-binding protein